MAAWRTTCRPQLRVLNPKTRVLARFLGTSSAAVVGTFGWRTPARGSAPSIPKCAAPPAAAAHTPSQRLRIPTYGSRQDAAPPTPPPLQRQPAHTPPSGSLRAATVAHASAARVWYQPTSCRRGPATLPRHAAAMMTPAVAGSWQLPATRYTRVRVAKGPLTDTCHSLSSPGEVSAAAVQHEELSWIQVLHRTRKWATPPKVGPPQRPKPWRCFERRRARVPPHVLW